MWGIRYSESPKSIRREIRRGYSFAGWGCVPTRTWAEAHEEYPGYVIRYSREVGGWLPTAGGLCVVCCEETLEDAIDAFQHRTFALEFPWPAWAFECTLVGTDDEGYTIVRPKKETKIIKIESPQAGKAAGAKGEEEK